MTLGEFFSLCQEGRIRVERTEKGFKWEKDAEYPWNGEDVEGFVKEYSREILDGIVRGKHRSRFAPMVLSELELLPPPVWLVKDHLVRDTLAVMYGPPGVGKTFVGLHFGLSVAAGQPVFGNETPEGAVVYAIGEGLQAFWRRVDAWLRGRRVNPRAVVEKNFFVIGDLPNLREPSTVKDFLAEVAPLKPGLVVIDTLNRALFGGNENSPEDMGTAVTSLEAIRRATGACVLAIHHTGKEEARGARGHSSLKGAVRTEIRVEEGKEPRALVAVCEKQSDWMPFDRLYLKLEVVTLVEASPDIDPISSCFLVEATRPKSSGNEEKILAVFADPAFPNELTYSELLKYSEVPLGSFKRALRSLVEQGRLALHGRKYVVPK